MRSLGLAYILMLVSGVSWLAESARADEPPPGSMAGDMELAKAHYNTGQIYYQRGRYADASREFEEAYRLSGRAALLYNIGKSYDGAGDHARALAAYRRFLVAVPDAPNNKEAADRPEVVERVRHLAKLVGTAQVRASVDGSTVAIDGQPVGTSPLAEPIELNPGSHHIEIAHEGFATWRADVVAAPGVVHPIVAEQVSLVKVIRVEVTRPEQKVPIYKRWWLWTAVGVVVVAGAVAGGVVGSQQPPVSGPYAQLPAVR